MGRVIADRYRILALIGEGGMGAVYVAEHLLVGRKVAVKRLHPELASDEKAIARLRREARAAGATGHENVVEVLDLGYADDGAPFLVMEYLRGQSLAQILQLEGKLPVTRACHIAGQVLSALEAVHTRGIVHRDLKPDNILLTRRRGDPDFVKVVDFGISKVRADEGEPELSLTRTGVMLGTPFYMSPEQARGMKALDHRVDLYATGVILYEALGGRLPFEGENYHQLLQCILTGKHPPIATLRVDLDPGLAAAIERAIALDPDDRYQSASEMLKALMPYGAKESHGNEGGGRLPSEPPSAFEQPSGPRLTPLMATERAPEALLPNGGRASSTPAPRGLAPRPRNMGGEPRPFEARSDDWRDEGSAGVAEPAATYVPQRFTSPAGGLERPTPGELGITRAEEGATPTAVKGSLVLCVIDFLRELNPQALTGVLRRLDGEVNDRIGTVRLPMAWLSLSDFCELLLSAERELGSSDGSLTVKMGRAVADRELSTTHRLFMRSATPAMAVERLPRLFRTYHSTGEICVERASGSYRILTDGIEPDALSHALLFGGFCQRMIELAGGQDVRASVVACRGSGDPATITALRWK
ncbi:MAG: protein kinase [Sandaracinaceae bacterium]